jgi:hypothetical protein
MPRRTEQGQHGMGRETEQGQHGMGRETGHGATDLLAVLEHGDPLDTKGGDPEDELVELVEGDVPTCKRAKEGGGQKRW